MYIFQEGGMDIYIGGVRNRNAALHGDVVAIEFAAIDQWKVRKLN